MHQYDAFAAELKFLVDEETATAAREWIRRELDADPHAADIGGDGYQTVSLYFDTSDFDLFFRRRSTARAKFRIRRYNSGPTVFLERKMKVEGRLFKRRSDCALEDLAHIGGSGSWSGSWFDRRLENRRLRPVCQVAYNRTARVGMSPSGPIRLTIDTQVTGVSVDGVRFSGDRGHDVLPGQAVLEMKYRAHLPVLFKRLIEELGIVPRSFSKYRATVKCLNLVEGVEEQERMVFGA